MRDALGTVTTVVVLGGTSDIAFEAVRAIGPTGTVVLAGRDTSALDRVGERLPGVRVVTRLWDASRPAAAAELLAELADEVGDLDVVIAAAGVLADQERSEADLEYAAEAMSVNYVGVGIACLAAAQALRRQGHGVLVILSSVAAVRARRVNYVYGSTKAGLDALGSGLADALVGSGAEVVVVRPGFVRTKMTAGMPDGPLAVDAAVVGRAIAEAVAYPRPLVWVPRGVQPLMTVLRSVPRPLWRRLGAR